jgi:hypothetical protein
MPDQPPRQALSASRHLAATIRQLLQQTLALDTHTKDYMATTFGDRILEQLPQIMVDNSNPERDTLLDLIFFPDEAFQKRLEPSLERFALKPAQVESVNTFLMETPLKVCLTDDTLPLPLALTMPTECIRPFVARLNMTRTLPTSLRETIDAYATPSWQTAVKVKLRNGLFAYSPKRTAFLKAFIEDIFSQQIDVWDLWDWLLVLLAEHREPQNLLDFFIHKAHSYRAALQMAKDHHQKMQSSNREMLILQGVRLPHIHEAELMRHLTWIQMILLKVYGQLPQTGGQPVAQDLGRLNPDTDMDTIIGLMS